MKSTPSAGPREIKILGIGMKLAELGHETGKGGVATLARLGSSHVEEISNGKMFQSYNHVSSRRVRWTLYRKAEMKLKVI